MTKAKSTGEDTYFSAEELDYYPKFEGKEVSIKPVPTRIRWQSGEILGKGSFGCVVKGFNLQNGQTMAVKQVPLVGSDFSQEKIDALQQEIEVLSELKHKNIVRYLGSKKEKENLNIFLEFVPGFHSFSIKNQVSECICRWIYLISLGKNGCFQ